MYLGIGLTGRKRAGKTETVRILEEMGFEIRTTRSAVMQYIIEDLSRGNPNDAKNQQYWGNQARILNEGDIWMERLLKKQISSDVVFDSARYPDQDSILRKNFPEGRYLLLAIDAPFELRYERNKEDARPGDPTSLDDFRMMDDRDWNGYLRGDGQNVEECFAHADCLIENTGTLEELRTKIEAVVKNLRR